MYVEILVICMEYTKLRLEPCMQGEPCKAAPQRVRGDSAGTGVAGETYGDAGSGPA